ncbi:MAG: FAD-dependent oxidoreductase, partial [Erysipelotrichaceae bacterium]|nr:FAD-dependent oxidoreductase [Erysipelotrichaceae bacterium]
MKEIYDVLIIGAGPAGLTAAIYASRANLSVLMIEGAVNGGKLSKTYEIENYPGIEKIGGVELADQLTKHGQKFGAKLISGNVEKVIDGETKKVVLSDG